VRFEQGIGDRQLKVIRKIEQQTTTTCERSPK